MTSALTSAALTSATFKSAKSVAALLGLAAVVGLGGCGVRGPLDAPPSATAPETQGAQADSGQGKKENAAPKPHKPFILDGLLR